MIKRSTKYILEGVAAVGALTLLAAAGLVLALSQGPISLSPVMPWIEDLVQDDKGDSQLVIGDLALDWDQTEFSLLLRAHDVSLQRRDGEKLVAVPEVGLTLSGQALQRGIFAPSSVRLTGLSLSVLRKSDGQFDLGPFSTAQGPNTQGDQQAEDAPAPDFGNLFAAISGGEALPSNLRYIELIQVADAKLFFRDELTGAEWLAPQAEVNVVRKPFGLAAQIAGRVQGVEGHHDWPVVITMAMDQQSGAGRLDLSFEDVELAELVRKVPNLSFLDGVAVDVSGEIAAPILPNGSFDTVRIQLQAADGRITLPKIDDDTLAFDFATLTSRMVPGPLGTGAAKVMIDDLQLFAGDVRINASGWYDRLAEGDAPALQITGGMSNISVDALKNLWPSELGRGAYKWVAANMDQGHIPTGTVHINMTADMLAGDRPMSEDALDILFELDDGAAHFLRPMPPLRQATATGHLTGKSFSMKVHRGLLYLDGQDDPALEVLNGEFRVPDFTVKPSRAEVDLTANGKVNQVLHLIDLKPLGFPSKMGLNPDLTSGRSSSHLRLTIPLIKDLQLDDLFFAVRSTVQDGVLPPIIDGIDFDNAQLVLNVSASGLRAEGTTDANGVPLQVTWSEAFKKDETADGLTTKVQARALMTPADCGALNLPCDDWYQGVADVTLNVAGQGANLKTMSLAGDLGAISFQIPFSGWTKQVGMPLSGTVDLLRHGDGGWIVQDGRASGDSVTVQAIGKLDKGFAPEYIEAPVLKLGPKTDLAGIVDWKAVAGLSIMLEGPSLDLRALFAGDGDETDESAPVGQPELPEHPGANDEDSEFHLAAKLGRLWLGENYALSDVKVDSNGRYLRPDFLDLRATTPSGKPAQAMVRQLGPAVREARVNIDDFGDLMSGAGLASGLTGGTLQAGLRYGMDDLDYTGGATVKNLTISNAPFIAQLGNLSTPGGIATLLQGGGVRLNEIELPFSARQGVIAITNGKAVGPTIGAHFDGVIREEGLALDLIGTVAPAYQLNAALGQIPLIGEALAGGKEGLVAFRFKATGTVDDPKLSFNPLSALTPGFLRNIFGGQTKAKGLPEPTAKPKGPNGPTGPNGNASVKPDQSSPQQ